MDGIVDPTGIPCITFELPSLYFLIKLLMAWLIFKAKYLATSLILLNRN